MTNTPESIANSFYNAFKLKDADSMIKYYHPELKFYDPAFGDLSYDQACGMWKMLCESAKDLSISHSILNIEGDHVETKWIAEYTFSKTNRRVHNEITAHMKITEGRIIEHIDLFSLHKWATQAMGFRGWLLGNTSFFKKKLHEQTNGQLTRYLEKSTNLN